MQWLLTETRSNILTGTLVQLWTQMTCRCLHTPIKPWDVNYELQKSLFSLGIYLSTYLSIYPSIIYPSGWIGVNFVKNQTLIVFRLITTKKALPSNRLSCTHIHKHTRAHCLYLYKGSSSQLKSQQLFTIQTLLEWTNRSKGDRLKRRGGPRFWVGLRALRGMRRRREKWKVIKRK